MIASPSKERKPLGLAMEPSTLSEEEQINLAIQRSLREAEGHSSKHDADNNDCEDLDPFSSTDEDSKDSLPKDQDKNHKNEASLPENAVTYEDFIGSDTGTVIRCKFLKLWSNFFFKPIFANSLFYFQNQLHAFNYVYRTERGTYWNGHAPHKLKLSNYIYPANFPTSQKIFIKSFVHLVQ